MSKLRTFFPNSLRKRGWIEIDFNNGDRRRTDAIPSPGEEPEAARAATERAPVLHSRENRATRGVPKNRIAPRVLDRVSLPS